MNKKLLLLSALILQGALTVEPSSAIEPDFKKELAKLAALTKARGCKKMMNYPLHFLVAPKRYNLDPQEALQKLKIFIELGFDVDDQDASGETPLHNATFYNNVPAIKLLLQNEANANILSNRGSKPINIAESRSRKALALLVPHTTFERSRRGGRKSREEMAIKRAIKAEAAFDAQPRKEVTIERLFNEFMSPDLTKIKRISAKKVALINIKNLIRAAKMDNFEISKFNRLIKLDILRTAKELRTLPASGAAYFSPTAQKRQRIRVLEQIKAVLKKVAPYTK